MSDTGQSDVDGSSVLQYWIFSKDVLFRVISSGNGNMAHSSPGSLSLLPDSILARSGAARGLIRTCLQDKASPVSWGT